MRKYAPSKHQKLSVSQHGVTSQHTWTKHTTFFQSVQIYCYLVFKITRILFSFHFGLNPCGTQTKITARYFHSLPFHKPEFSAGLREKLLLVFTMIRMPWNRKLFATHIQFLLNHSVKRTAWKYFASEGLTFGSAV